MNLLGMKCDDRIITRVFDLCTGTYPPHTVLASVQYADKRFGVVVVNVATRTATPLTATGRHAMLLNEAAQPPIFEVNTDGGHYDIHIYTLRERGIVVREEYLDLSHDHETEWRVIGETSSGATALKEFDKHEVTLEAD
ncbi:MAG: hypothetical protein ACM3TU_01830 [Bacillota bacterium]